MTDANDCPECNGFGLIAVEGAPHAWTRATADDPVDARPRKRCGQCGATAQGRPVPVPVVLRARLIVVDQWGDEAVDTAPSCGNCRWAREPHEGKRDHVGERLSNVGFPLRCELAELIDTQYLDADSEARLAKRMCVTIDGSDYRGDLYVRPDFGCVQWEPRP